MFTQSIPTQQTEDKFTIVQNENSIYYQVNAPKELKAIEISADLYRAKFYFADRVKTETEETNDFTEEEQKIRGIVSSAVQPPLPEMGHVSSNSKCIEIYGMQNYSSMAKCNRNHIAENFCIEEQLHPVEWILTKARNSGVLSAELYDRIRVDVRHRTLQIKEYSKINKNSYQEMIAVCKEKYSPNNNFKRITTSADTHEFAGKIVAYLSSNYYFSGGNNAIILPVKILGQEVRFAQLPTDAYDWQGSEKGYDMNCFLKPNGIGSAHALINSQIQEDSALAMRLATLEELHFLKVTLEFDQGRLNYREKEADIKMLKDEIARQYVGTSLHKRSDLQDYDQFSFFATKRSAVLPSFKTFTEGKIDWSRESENKDKSEMPKPSKVYLIKGGDEKSRQKKAYEMAKQDGLAMYAVYHNKDKSEYAIVFSSEHDTFNLMTFDLAKQIAGEQQLSADFSTQTFGSREKFGVINMGETYTKKINIIGLNKATVLLALYNNALCEGVAFDSNPIIRQLIAMNPPATLDGAELKIKARFESDNLWFDYIDLGSGPRPLKVNLSGFEFDSSVYDEYHGKGTANAIISDLRQTSVCEYEKYVNRSSFAALLAKMGSVISQNNNRVMPSSNDLENNNLKEDNHFKPNKG